MARSERTCTPSWSTRAAALLLFASISWSVNQTADPLHGISREDLNLVGSVREVLVEEATVFSSASESREGARSRVEFIAFSEDGLVTEWIEFDRSGDPESTRRYTYSGGLLTLEEEYRRFRWPTETITYTHDEAEGQTTAEVRSGNDALRKTIVYERGSNGKLTTVTEYDEEGAETTKVVYTYTAGGKRADRYDPDGELTSWSIETFDTGGRLVAISAYTAGSEDSPFTISYEYDSHDNVTLEETSGRPPLPFVVVTATPSETRTSYEYSYDENENWVKRVKSVWVPSDDDPHWQATTATTRSFRYYN